MELEIQAGVQRPCCDVSDTSHRHLYEPHFEMDPRHRGQAWVHMEDPSRSTHVEQGTLGHLHLVASDVFDPVTGEGEVDAVAAALLGGEVEEVEELLDEDLADVAGVREGGGPSRAEVKEILSEAAWVDGTSQMLRLPYYSPKADLMYDAMHTIGGVVSDTGLGTLLGSRYSERVKEHEDRLGRFPDLFHGKLNGEGVKESRAALRRASCVPGAGRLLRLVDASKSAKTHSKFLLAGPIGLYMLSCVRHFLPESVLSTLRLLFQAGGLLWSKELHQESLPTLQALVTEAVCMVERHLPICERDIKLHLLTQLVRSIKNYGESSVYCFVERTTVLYVGV